METLSNFESTIEFNEFNNTNNTNSNNISIENNILISTGYPSHEFLNNTNNNLDVFTNVIHNIESDFSPTNNNNT